MKHGAGNKTLHVIIYSPFPAHSGGRENWLYNICKIANKKGQKIFIYSFFTLRKNFYRLKKWPKVEVIRVPTLRIFNLLYLIVNKLLHNKLFIPETIIFQKKVEKQVEQRVRKGDIVLTMSSIIELAPMVELKKKGKKFKLIASIRGPVVKLLSEKLPDYKIKFEKQEKMLLKSCDQIIVNGNDTKANLKSKGFQTEVVPNGVNTKLFANPIDNKETEEVQKIKGENYKIIMMVATLRKMKGTIDLIKTVPYLKGRCKQKFKVLFVGKGNQIKYNQIAKNLGVEEEVLFLGEKKNIPALLKYVDIVMSLAHGSGLSMSNLEAMASGKAIVAWDAPVYTQILEHRKTGMLVEFQNYQKLAKTINELLEKDNLRKKLGKNAQENVQKYDWENVYNKLTQKINL